MTNAIKPVKKSRVSDDVVVQLARLVMTGEFAAGDRLPPERELAVMLGVNRTSLREALRRMETMGLIRVRQGDGIYVEDHSVSATLDFIRFLVSNGLGLDRDFIMNLEEARRMFAVDVVGLAAERADEAALAELQGIVDGFPREVTPGYLSGEWDFRFFHALARATKNRVFVSMLNTIKDLFGILRGVYTQLDEGPAEVAALNGEIVAAIRARDGARATALVEQRMNRDRELLAGMLGGE